MAGIPHHGSIEVGLGNAVFPVNRFNVQHTLITFAVRNLLSHCLCNVEVIKYVFHFGVRYNRIRSFNLTCRQTVRLNELEPQGLVYSYADWVKFYGINYYLGDRVRIFDKLNPAQGYVLVTDELQEQFLQDTEDTYQVEEVYRTPLRSCDLRRKVIVYKFSKK